MKIIKYFFYKLYSFSLSQGQSAAIWAFGMIMMFILANIYTVFDIILITTNSKLPQVGKGALLCIAGVIFFRFHSVFMKNGKPQEIIKEFDEIKGSKQKLNLLLLLYIIVSVIAFIYTIRIVREMNHKS